MGLPENGFPRLRTGLDTPHPSHTSFERSIKHVAVGQPPTKTTSHMVVDNGALARLSVTRKSV